MTTETYPRVIRPELDFLETCAALSALDAAQHLAEATIIDLRERGGDTESVEQARGIVNGLIDMGLHGNCLTHAIEKVTGQDR